MTSFYKKPFVSNSTSRSLCPDTNDRLSISKPVPFPCYKVMERIQQFIEGHHLFEPQDPLIVGVSGGMDSMTLLSFLIQTHQGKMIVAHINHGLRGEESDQEAEFVKNYAGEISLDFAGHQILPGEWERFSSDNKQEKARQIRQQFFLEQAKKNQAHHIVTAHQAQDQAETLLWRLIRGSGLRGLSGISPKVEWQGVTWSRPLLGLSREEILRFVQALKIPYVEDSSNAKIEYDRNWIRHKILPLLNEKNPNLVATLNETAQILREDHAILASLTEGDFRHLAQPEGGGYVLSIKEYRGLPKARRYRLLRHLWSRVLGNYRSITFHHIEKMDSLAHQSSPKSHYDLPKGYFFQKYYWKIYMGSKKT